MTANQGIGVYLDNSSGFRVHHNAFAGNEDQAVDGGSGDAQDVCGGSDGIGDTPYAIPPGSVDRYPLVFLNGSNTPPIPQVLRVDRVRAGEPAVFDATFSFDREDAPVDLAARWDFEGDGVWDTNWSTTKAATHVYPEPGNYRVVLEVRDRACATGRAEFLLPVEPALPSPPDPAAWASAFIGLTATAVALVLLFLWRVRGRRRRRGEP